MASQYPANLGLSISIALFVLSFSWLFVERTDQYPHLRRLTPLFAEGASPDFSSPHFRVVAIGFGYMAFWIMAASLSFLIFAMHVESNLPPALVSLTLGPVFYFLAPQTISASTTMLILWRVPDDPHLNRYPALESFRAGNRARNWFVFGFVVSVALTYGVPFILVILGL